MPAPPRAVPTVQIDDSRVRVTEWRFSPGATTGHHRHEYAYLVVPLASGRLLARAGGSELSFELSLGQSYSRPAGIEHEVVNVNDHPFAFVEIELKD